MARSRTATLAHAYEIRTGERATSTFAHTTHRSNNYATYWSGGCAARYAANTSLFASFFGGSHVSSSSVALSHLTRYWCPLPRLRTSTIFSIDLAASVAAFFCTSVGSRKTPWRHVSAIGRAPLYKKPAVDDIEFSHIKYIYKKRKAREGRVSSRSFAQTHFLSRHLRSPHVVFPRVFPRAAY
jgi:hypothetical protein